MNVQNTANYLKMKAMNTIASSKAATSGEKNGHSWTSKFNIKQT